MVDEVSAAVPPAEKSTGTLTLDLFIWILLLTDGCSTVVKSLAVDKLSGNNSLAGNKQNVIPWALFNLCL